MVNDRLRPQLEFADLAYAPPYTVTLTDAALVTPEGERIVEVGRLVITLAERPRKDEPLRFAGVTFDGGVIRLIVLEGSGNADGIADADPDADPEDGAGGGLAGFSRMLPDSRAPRAPSTPRRSFSDAIELRGVVFRDFALEYTPLGKTEPLRLDHISAEMDIPPDSDEAGWYAIGFESGRAPGFELDIDWRLNLDTLDTEIPSLTAAVDAGPDTIRTLPPALVGFMAEHEVTGTLRATGRASANLRDPGGARAELLVEGEGVGVAYREYRLPLDTSRIPVSLADQTLRVDNATIGFREGSLTVEGSANLDEAGDPFGAAWSVEPRSA